ncbi:putative N-(5-amino-5-carboxypentanoyl)-L-cysteinyl-D-valine synthase [Candidatus Protofrankia californiensis]|uniref:Putative N-(5-amino-5-carboxypentanoyl)-L-cysteinyl-D-valine synthase n=1 Tax=Candidatus Protofrankia californiensis TaxID=1839754 RepID=A0A1C3NU01_9ACTN|nr:putative N-(5-amino-5-carboxypentanoyl)-L-cysteinyl-D-valine synthase [Candidatus Protofrankia californiensis]
MNIDTGSTDTAMTATTELAINVVDGAAAPQWIVVLTGLAALAAVAPRWTWRNSGHLDTIAHEGGHALVAYLLGYWVFGVWLFSDTSGLTGSYGRPSRVASFLVSAAGYTAPSVLGLGAAALLSAGHVTATLMLTVVALAALFLVIRNNFGIMLVVTTAGVVVLALRSASAGTQSALACFLTWFLLLSGPRSVLDLRRQRRNGPSSSDADAMAELTGIPGGIWVAGFGLVGVLCLFRGTALLLS